jgi:hypothetical protein
MLAAFLGPFAPPPVTSARPSAAAGTIARPRRGRQGRLEVGTGGRRTLPLEADRRGRRARGGGREFVAGHRSSTSAVPIVRGPIGPKCSTLAGWPRHDVSAHRQSARSPSVKRSSATSARARAPPTSFRVSSGSRRSRSPTTSPTLPARFGRQRSGSTWSRPGVSAAASSSGSGTASTALGLPRLPGSAHPAAQLRRPAGLSPTSGTPSGARARPAPARRAT